MKTVPSIPEAERRAVLFGGILALVALGTALLAPQAVVSALRLAVFACLAPAVGCTVFALIHRITGGQWTAGLAPFIRAGVSLLPWIWLAAIPVVIAARGRFSPGLGYESSIMLGARAVLFAVIFFGLRWALSDGVGDEDDARRNRRAWVGPVGLIVLFFMLTFLADDWLESLEENWHSTAFTVVWIGGQAMCGLSLCVLGGLLSGVDPESKGSKGRPLGLDWGNLLLAAMMFWAYVAFAQFLIIWAGNLPEETSWYLRREHGIWGYVMPFVALVGFALPFFLLLSRRLKQSARGLGVVACLLLVAQLAYTAWLIIPAQGNLTPAGGFLALAALLASLFLFGSRFMRAARIFGRTV